jgi:uncharacterized protein (TIRG00374 family)
VAAAKAALTIIIIWVLLSQIELAPVASRLKHLSIAGIVLALLPFFAQVVLCAERWRILCGRLNVHLRFSLVLQVVAIGTFFSQALPSAVGGDAMRIWLLVRDRVMFGKAVSAVLCDRMVALVVQIGLITVTLPLFYRHVADPNAQLVVTAFVAVGVAGFTALLLFGAQLAHLLRSWKFSHPLGELAHDFHRLFTAPYVTVSLIAWSLAVHLLTVVGVWVIASVLSIETSLLDCLIMIPPVSVISMLPVSIGGWGVREGAMVVGLGLMGVAPSDALAISICFGLAHIIIGLPGGVLWLRNRRLTPAPEVASARD